MLEVYHVLATAEHLPTRKPSAYENMTWNLRHKVSPSLSLQMNRKKQNRNAILNSKCKCTHNTANLLKTGEIKYLHVKEIRFLVTVFCHQAIKRGSLRFLTISRGEDKSFGSCYDPFNREKCVPALLWQDAVLQFKILDKDPQRTVITVTTKGLTSKLSHTSVFQNSEVCNTAQPPHFPRNGNQARMS